MLGLWGMAGAVAWAAAGAAPAPLDLRLAPGRASALVWDRGVHLPLTLGAAGASVALMLAVPAPDVAPGVLRPGWLEGRDIGPGPDGRLQDGPLAMRFSPRRSWAALSDGLLVGAMVAGVALPHAAWSGPAADVGAANVARGSIVATGLLVNVGLTSALKNALGRPRPYARMPATAVRDSALDPRAIYRDPARPELGFRSADARRSLPSGHTSSVAAAGFGWARVAARSRPAGAAPGRTAAAFGGAAAATGLVGVARVKAGKHHPTDVLAGAALGTAVGLAWPALYLRPAAEVAVQAGVGPTLSIGGVW